ncbi:hypothetical protein BC938DRAFT_476863 [Jimgerdemannia flammicorona]|uniref:DUF7082 domain-containing protein n=1 Tax=Jimgerdemannia flammicorona TaxID=994334 RepID=A0A433PDT8_9FUNG|nr:hypothetical protein BC938DRAFT_476863 [Jimgerdemannia flammicorona]
MSPTATYSYRQSQQQSPYGYTSASTGSPSSTMSNMNLGGLPSGDMTTPPGPLTPGAAPAGGYFVPGSPPSSGISGYMTSAGSSMAGYPYASLLNKANLKISGNLEDMALNWSPEEWETRRRLVQFWRRQEGNDIHCTFAPVAPADRVPNSIVVSCIYWQEKNDCYITSVDCIYLLESLIGVRFTVEEKNRIRRNLEGFRPQTVSKCKPESAEFFKLIMSFPNPKPRNIEKDVKVFPWKVLSYALKKIISKYTASYSSTASVNIDAFQTTAYPAGGQMGANSSSPSPYGYDDAGGPSGSSSHSPSSGVHLDPSMMPHQQPQHQQQSSSGLRYANAPSPHHIVASQQPLRSNSATSMHSRSPYPQTAGLQPSHYDAVPSQHLSPYGSPHHLAQPGHRTPNTATLDSPHSSHPSLSPHVVAAEAQHEPLSPHNMHHYSTTTAVSGIPSGPVSAYTSHLQPSHTHSPSQPYAHYAYSTQHSHQSSLSPYSHVHGQQQQHQNHGTPGLSYPDTGAASGAAQVEIHMPKEEPGTVVYDAGHHHGVAGSHHATPRNLTPLGDEYHHHGGWGGADESSVRKGFANIVYPYDHGSAQGQHQTRRDHDDEEGDEDAEGEEDEGYIVGAGSVGGEGRV